MTARILSHSKNHMHNLGIYKKVILNIIFAGILGQEQVSVRCKPSALLLIWNDIF